MYIELFYLYRILGQLLPIYPVYVLMFQQKGLSLSAISGLLIIWCIPGFILEVPSSILADRWNRRNLMVIGRLLKGLCFIIWSFSASFTGFAIGFILWGTGSALCSGTEEAWLYDALKANGKENEFDRIWGQSSFYYQMTVGIASVIGSIIAAYNMQLTLWLSVISVLAGTAVAAILPEYNLHSQSQEDEGLRGWFTTLKEGMDFCLKHSMISLLVGINITILVSAGVLDEYDQLIVRSMGVPMVFVGTWGFLRYGMEALGGKAAWRVKRILNRYGIKKPIAVQLVIAACAGVLLYFTALIPALPMLTLYVLYYFLLAAGKVLFTDTLQTEVQHQGRATVQSLTAMLETPAGILIYTLFGMSGEFGKLQGAILSVAVWILFFCALFLFFQKVHILQKRKNGGLIHE